MFRDIFIIAWINPDFLPLRLLHLQSLAAGCVPTGRSKMADMDFPSASPGICFCDKTAVSNWPLCTLTPIWPFATFRVQLLKLKAKCKDCEVPNLVCVRPIWASSPVDTQPPSVFRPLHLTSAGGKGFTPGGVWLGSAVTITPHRSKGPVMVCQSITVFLSEGTSLFRVHNSRGAEGVRTRDTSLLHSTGDNSQ